MQREQSAGLILFRQQGKNIQYLLLHYATKNQHWDFPKGHIEKGETAHDAAKRETIEETGLRNFYILEGFETMISYYFQKEGKTIFKEVQFYVAEATDSAVTLSHEHIGFRWVTYSTALKQLTYETARDALRKAHVYVTKLFV